MDIRPIAIPKIVVALFVALGVLLPTASHAATGAWVAGSHVKARLLSAVDGTGDLATVPAGLELELDGDWKTYWRSPGDAGLPPTLDWAGSDNLAGATLLYPRPERLTLLGIQTFGYKHDVAFPLDLAVADKGRPLDLKLKLDILVCANLCIPQTLDLRLALPAGPASPDPDASQSLAKARAALPADERTSGLTLVSAQEISEKGQPALELTATSDQPFAAPDAIAELKPDVALGEPKVRLSADRREARFVLPPVRKLPVGASLSGRAATLTVWDGPRALERTVTITAGASIGEEEPGPSLLAVLGIAVLGGLILNLMPCVLPVLSIKLISVVGQGGRAPAKVRAGFLATAAGIVVSFLAIAAVLIGLKAGGRTIGWGIQFQEPGFISVLAVVVTVFACHLAGFFEVSLPRVIGDAAAKRIGPDENLLGHFATGAFATVLATPCSAPFLGTAIGFALASEPLAMVGVFLALGIGLALPYLVVAALPRLASALPRPGRWMIWLKQAMALPLAATAVWLLLILASQAGTASAVGVAVLLVGLSAFLAFNQRLPETRRPLVLPVVVIVALAGAALPGTIATQIGAKGARADDAIAWNRFDRDRIRSLVSQGKTVFVDVTADWCLTCQANKKFVLSHDALAKRLNDRTIAMQADWTRPDPAIGAYLASYGRYGIPFNVVYGPGAPGGIVLPELLTTGDVDAALDKAGDTKASALEPPRTLAAAGAEK